jgi:predicted ferric reductase
MKKVLKVSLFLGAVFSPLILMLIYFEGNWYSFFSTWTLSIAFGLVSYTWFVIVLVLSARIRWLDRLYGHDKVMVFHAYLSIAALAMGVIHYFYKQDYFPERTTQSLLGEIGILLFIFIMVLTMLAMVQNVIHRLTLLDRLRLFLAEKAKWDYTVLKVIHNFLTLAFALIVVHSAIASSTRESLTRMIIMYGSGGLALAVYIYHKFIRLLVMKAGSFMVTDVSRDSEKIYTISMKREKGRLPRFRAGQFGFFRFASATSGFEEHPFTFSSAPQDQDLRITVKELGDYSTKLGHIPVNTKALMDGPYGIFTPRPGTRPLLFFAGGIGITPFLSMLSAWEKEQFDTPVVLFWSARHREELVEFEKLSAISKKADYFTFVPILSRPGEDWSGEKGRVNEQLLEKVAGPWLNPKSRIYICGPQGYRKGVRKALKHFKIPGRIIHSEQFSL